MSGRRKIICLGKADITVVTKEKKQGEGMQGQF